MRFELLNKVAKKGHKGFALMNNPTHENTKYKSELLDLYLQGYVTNVTCRVGEGWYNLYYITNKGVSVLSSQPKN
jgi:hypothetical protein